MRKIFLTIFAICLISKPLFSQQYEGVVKYVLTENFAKRILPLTFISKQTRERIMYQWGTRAEWQTAHLLYFKNKESRYVDSDEKVDKDAGSYEGLQETYSIKRNFETNTMSDALEMLGKTYMIEDSLDHINWKIGNNIKEIAGYICMNASTEDSTKFQKMTAWFALDLPLKSGPERFHGLPGLILELDINDGSATYVAQSVNFKSLTTEMDHPKKLKAKKIKNSTYQNMIKKYIDDKVKEEEYPYNGIRY